MGMVLSVPLLLFGIVLIVIALRRPPLQRGARRAMTPLERKSGRIIETEGPMPVSDYMQLCLGASAPRLLRHARSARRARRFRHRARSQPDVRRADRRLGRGRVAADGIAAEGAPRRARPGPRHADGGCAARRDGAAGFSRRAFGASGRDEPGPARAAAGRRSRARRSDRMASRRSRTCPDGPAIAIANEFVDALPVDQFVKDRDGWHLRMVGIADGRLAFVVVARCRCPAHAKARCAVRRDPGTAPRPADRAAGAAASRSMAARR